MTKVNALRKNKLDNNTKETDQSRKAEMGDWITLYSLDNKDVVEIRIEEPLSGLASKCLGCRTKDEIVLGLEIFEIQYIDSRKDIEDVCLEKDTVSCSQYRSYDTKEELKLQSSDEFLSTGENILKDATVNNIIEEQTPNVIETILSKEKNQEEENAPTPLKENKTKGKAEKIFHCIKDLHALKKMGKSRVTNVKNGNKIEFPKFQCPQCRTKYTSLARIADKTIIRLHNEKYINIDPVYDIERYKEFLLEPHPVESGSCCYVYFKHKPSICRRCKDTVLLYKQNQYRTKEKGVVIYTTRYCYICNVHHISLSSYYKYQSDWTLLNPDEIAQYEEQLRLKREERAKKRAEMKARKEAEAQRRKELQQSQNQKIVEKPRKVKTEPQNVNIKQREKEFKKQQSPNEKLYNKKRTIHEHDNKIRVKDFVVRRSIFKCRYNDHKLENIDGIISIIDSKGNVSEVKITAGYCPECNVFFIMESTYQTLKRRGTPICRVSDEKAYLTDNAYANGMKLAQESILKQYGYSVSQDEGLTSLARQKILSFLVNNKILTRNEIISYLDFFISQRKNQLRYEKAIERWSEDRDFISNYRIGQYSEYHIGGIHRKY